MNRIMDALPTGGLLPVQGQPKEMVAAGSLVAGIGLFVLSVLVVLAVGFFAGALVMTENVARYVLGKEEEPEAEPALVAPKQTIQNVRPAEDVRTIEDMEIAIGQVEMA